MLKRELGTRTVTAGDQHRTKRRKEASTGTQDVQASDTTLNGRNGEGGETLKEQALNPATHSKHIPLSIRPNSRGRTLSNDFLRRPSKRQYPDYYVLIAQPIALDDIKKKIEDSGYDSLESVRQDLELCFRNAKQYNMKESIIWNDAKDLLKLTMKSYNKMVPRDDAEEASKEKGPNLTRLLKSRLQRLSSKTDDTGRILCSEFMELPSNKLWPYYYQVIKEPMCIDTISGRLKRKEYHSAGDFAADVELIFSNAMTFNQEHTQIWEDALTLRDFFRHLMSDLPEPFALPEPTKSSGPKIKLKVPALSSRDPTNSNPPPNHDIASTKPLLLRVPAPNTSVADKTPTQSALTSSVPPSKGSTPAVTPTTVHTASLPTAVSRLSPIPQPTVQLQPTLTPAPPAPSKAPAPTALARASVVHPVQNNAQQAQASHQPSISPAPVPENHPFKLVLLKVEQSGRLIGLDHRDGVKTWVMRLAPGEKDVRISRILFLEDEGEEGTDVEDGEGDDTSEPAPKRKRGRPPKTNKAKLTAKSAPKLKPPKRKPSFKLEDVQIKLNGQAKSASDSSMWLLELTTGPNVLEVADKGGAAWRVHMERP